MKDTALFMSSDNRWAGYVQGVSRTLLAFMEYGRVVSVAYLEPEPRFNQLLWDWVYGGMSWNKVDGICNRLSDSQV